MNLATLPVYSTEAECLGFFIAKFFPMFSEPPKFVVKNLLLKNSPPRFVAKKFPAGWRGIITSFYFSAFFFFLTKYPERIMINASIEARGNAIGIDTGISPVFGDPGT